jgi:hypothetical protein
MEFRTRVIDLLKTIPESHQAIQEISEATDAVLNDWIKFIDHSPDSLEDWCLALLEFKKWEVAEKRPLTLAHKIEYLSCCREGGLNSGTLVSLTDLFLDYLKEYGVE